MIPGPARTGLVVGAPVGVSLTCRGFLLNVTCELVAVSWFSGIGWRAENQAILEGLVSLLLASILQQQNKSQKTAENISDSTW